MKKMSFMTAEQHTAVKRFLTRLAGVFPDLSEPEMLAGPLAEHIIGPLPHYSNLPYHNITEVSSVTVASFVMCYTYVPGSQDPLVVMIQRGDKGPKGEDRFGVPGGYVNLDYTVNASQLSAFSHGEQPTEGAVRELGEELIDAEGKAILDIDPVRLRILTSGIDYRRRYEKATLACQYNGYAVELTPIELERIQYHIERLQTDPDYRRAVEIRSNGEVTNVLLVPLDQIETIYQNQFTHPNEFEGIQDLRASLTSSRPVTNIRSRLTPMTPHQA